MKTWFDTHRIDMLNSACEKVLSPQIQGELSFAEIIQLAGLLESHNNEAIRKNNSIDLSQHDLDIGSELRQAIVAEVVAAFDDRTISNLTWGAEKEHVLDFGDVNVFDEASYVGDKLKDIADRMRKILNYFPDDGDNFILCTPLMISVLQAATASVFVSNVQGGFKGPNNIMLVGHADGAPVYSYLPQYSSNNEEDLVILGNYKNAEDCAVTHRLVVKSLTFT